MDWNTVCIIDNQEQKDITADVLTIEKDEDASRFRIVFENSPKEFLYGFARITYLENPEKINTEGKLVFLKRKRQLDIKTILRFGDWCRIQYSDDILSTVRYSDLVFVRDKRLEKCISEVMDYLVEASSANDIKIPQQDEEPGFLETQLKSMPVREDSILCTFLYSSKITHHKDVKPILAPFSSNKSQIDAIRKALENNISVIQGPPGTGKTQTILNIIANLLFRGKTVAVVSGNNEATRNVYEKLVNERLDSLCATLGNKENITAFFASLPSNEVLEEQINDADEVLDDEKMNRLASIASSMYSAMIERAGFQAQIEELRFEELANNLTPAVLPVKLRRRFSGKISSKQCLEYSAFIEALYEKKASSIFRKLKMFIRFGYWPKSDFIPTYVIDYLQQRYYHEKKAELTIKIRDIDGRYPEEKKELIKSLYSKKSEDILFYKLKEQFKDLEYRQFSAQSYRNDPDFVKYYPIVLSTTHSLKYCSPKDILYDYVIIDESSQVDLASAAIALGQAKNVVIVGDSRQLPHVIPEKFHEALDEIRKKYVLDPYMDYRRYSILESIQIKYGKQIPSTLLNEHYRCDPEIIGFCNKRFYDNQLVIQTTHKEGCGITLIETPSHTALGRRNERQAEIIVSEIIPNEKDCTELGIVAPYRDQVDLVRQRLNSNDILVDTVHKFQGKERSTMVLSSTSDRVLFKDDPDYVVFLNNPNLINVAISRAKNHLYVIASKELLEQQGTILNDLEKYVSYYSRSSKRVQSKVYSVFDLMFDDYAPILKDMKERMLKISQFDSENIIGTIIDDLCKTQKYGQLGYKHNYPLYRIVNAEKVSEIEDRNFIQNPGTHCDFVIFDRLNKRIRLIVEVDGKQHENYVQKQRDERKDRILREAGLSLIRIKTTDLNVKEKIANEIL